MTDGAGPVSKSILLKLAKKYGWDLPTAIQIRLGGAKVSPASRYAREYA